jgi:hypothetical protein
MRYFFLVSIVFLSACDYGVFDKDKRQILAKDYVHSHLPPHVTNFDITSFREDTISNMLDSNFKHAIAYTLHYQFTDSLTHIQQRQTIVLFTPDGHSIITSIEKP